MKITVKSSGLVKPGEPTFNGQLHLSILDQIGCVMHVPTIYFYRPEQQRLNPSDTIVNILKSSLSKVLVHFYPLTGRLRCIEAGRLVLECNEAGVEFIEAKSDAKLDQLGDFSPSPEFCQLFPCIDYIGSSMEELPLLYVQLTEFQCGGIALSLTMSHAVADGQSALHFIFEWARIAQGEQVGIKPFHDRKLVCPRDIIPGKEFQHSEFQPPPLLIGETSNENERKKPTTMCLLKLTKKQVDGLRITANTGKDESTGSRPYSRYEVIAAHVWRSACKARKLPKDQQTVISICIDIRNRIEPPLPLGYFGNAIIDVFASATSGELLSNHLSFAAKTIRDAISQVTCDYVNSVLNYVEKQKDISNFQDLHALKQDQGPFYGNPNLAVVSWLSLPLHDLDFGWGKEICMSPGSHDSDGDFVILPSRDKDGYVVVSLCLQQVYMEDFKTFFFQNDT